MKTVMIKTSELKPYKNNAKKHNETQINNVAESIKQFGFVQPIVIDKNGVIIIGHCRLLAAQQLGMDEVPCVLVDNLTNDQVKALRIVDNKSNESPWYIELLSAELSEIDLSDFDFDFNLPNNISDDELDDFFEDSEPKEKEPKRIQCPHCGEWFEA